MLWKEKYRIGVPLIDEQHEELFARVGEFVKTLRANEDWDAKVAKVNETLDFMAEYVVSHFADEEELQRKVGFPESEEHKKIHDDMVAFVLEVKKEYEAEGYKEELMQKFAGRLLAWLINHVAASDLRIAEFVKGQEALRHE